MMTMAWICMAGAVFVTVLLLGDVRREIEYNRKRKIRQKGADYGLQKTAYRENRELLRRCG